MTKYAFVIDQRKCIGCHACTVACKAEHDVPIGVNRTWVKYIERGTFPDTRRHFLVNRCNHCDNAPCVAICPTKALYKRDDGIVDFDARRCIGCKSCMQACPYDALYIDPSSHTAAKCNYCAHRTELGLEPACVVVCPERAIIAGDMQDTQTEIAQLIAREPVRVRKPEQGTGPNVYYLGADEAAINPEESLQELPHMTMWSTLLQSQREAGHAFDSARSLRPEKQRTAFASPQQGSTLDLPAISVSDQAGAFHVARSHIVYDPPKERSPWGWMVSAYLGTKSIGAGAMLVAAAILILHGFQGTMSTGWHTLLGISAPIIGGLGIALTLLLLVADLKRPARALFLLTKGNPTSWLVWGGYILGVFGLVEVLWFGAALFHLATLLQILLLPTLLLAVAAAGYTAFLFGQAEGRDFWQSPLLLPILLVQAVLAGAASLGIVSWLPGADGTLTRLFTPLLLSAIVVHICLVLIEVFGSHSSRHIAAAAHTMMTARLRPFFLYLFLGAGSLLPVVLLVLALLLPGAQLLLLGLAGLLALSGLFAYEHCFVVAGQAVPLS
ncbi:4Fe-4S dicluster domain-containing protein [Dictyobacter aurantiacus]|uniref:4Fe-4S ferredoxin n=1 Tax=Dictyobacter aurantiacus TaxID=1936993 RepID=A0A401ZT22_9CHLR|nr:4Fe-4S dicluster domain-containing protein [Dictyobacter aurantiacus]GCE10011.1 4Fe-4S ferredoxin [Dictyobacter aurantiacus]